jgi:GNAT superfamily N-acetyltransferase
MREEAAGKAEALALSAPQVLNKFHDLSRFDCGEASINSYLLDKALKAQHAKHDVVYVTCFAGTNSVAGFYTLSTGSIARGHATSARLRRNAPEHLPVVVLGRMGVTRQAAGQGLATDLLQDAIERALAASEVVGCVTMIVHPLTERLEQFYAKYAGFRLCRELSPKTMMMSLQ